MCEPVTCVAACGLSAYGCRTLLSPITDRVVALRVKRRSQKETALMHQLAAAQPPEGGAQSAAHTALVDTLWRFSHLLLARADYAHDEAAAGAALRLSVCEDVPLDAMRVVGEAMLAAVDARHLQLRVPTWKERMGNIQLPGLRGGTGQVGQEGAGSAFRRELARDAFVAIGALIEVASDSAPGLEAEINAIVADVLDSPAACARPGQREVVAESLRRVAAAVQREYRRELDKQRRAAAAAEAAAATARKRATSGVRGQEEQEVRKTCELTAGAESATGSVPKETL